MKKRLFVLILMMLLMVNTVYASEVFGEVSSECYNRNEFLNPGQSSSRDIKPFVVYGEYLSTGMLEIVNQGNGSIYICVDTLAHIDVDRICHTVFLDQWDDKKEIWTQVGSWDFEKTKEEEGGKLSMMTDTITISDVQTNKYYRARALHMVEIGDEIEGCASETHGVLITKD